MTKKICIFTGTRAEYGLLKPLMLEIKRDKALTLQVIVSGMHLYREFGLTYRQIEKDGFRIDEKVRIPLGSDSPLGINRAMGACMVGAGKAYERLRPDIIVVLGDRFEALSASIAAMLARIPLAHISGGEATYGLIDEAIRHSITKMSYLHFTVTPEYRLRVIQLGEDPQRVFCTGSLNIDNIRSLRPLSKAELEKWSGIRFDKRNLLITFHPVTLENNTSKEQFRNLLMALDGLKDTSLFFTKANADTFGRVINNMIDDYVACNRHKARAFASMGQLRYLSAMKYVDAVVGNSSSGIIEAPSFRIGTINIGDRQAGRLRAKSVIDCEPATKSITGALKELYSCEFQRKLANVKNPYDRGYSAKKIKSIIKACSIKTVKKSFYDILKTRADSITKEGKIWKKYA